MDAAFQARYAELESVKDWFVNLAEKVGPEAAERRCEENEWSLAEVIEHLVIAERAVIAGIEAARDKKVPFQIPPLLLRREIVMLVLRNGIKVPAVKRAIPERKVALDSLINEWKELRERLRANLETRPAEDGILLAFSHPRAGKLSLNKSLQFVHAHLVYHHKRAQKTLAPLL
jgi:uncharacterized damage-inducible protein DinB